MLLLVIGKLLYLIDFLRLSDESNGEVHELNLYIKWTTIYSGGVDILCTLVCVSARGEADGGTC